MANFNIRNTEIEVLLRKLGRMIKDLMPKGWGFAVLIFDHNTTEGSIFYISDSSRPDMLKAMEEFIAKNKN